MCSSTILLRLWPFPRFCISEVTGFDICRCALGCRLSSLSGREQDGRASVGSVTRNPSKVLVRFSSISRKSSDLLLLALRPGNFSFHPRLATVACRFVNDLPRERMARRRPVRALHPLFCTFINRSKAYCSAFWCRVALYVSDERCLATSPGKLQL